MADKNGGALASFKEPKIAVNLSARYPKYDPGVDAKKKENVGKFGAPIHGYLLGRVSLPATIPDPQTGELKPWEALVVELIQPCPASLEEDGTKMREPGTCIIVTATAAIDSMGQKGLDKLISDPVKVCEVLIKPQVSKTKRGLSLWTFPMFGIVGVKDRAPHQYVTLDAFAALHDFAKAAPELTGVRTRALPAATEEKEAALS